MEDAVDMTSPSILIESLKKTRDAGFSLQLCMHIFGTLFFLSLNVLFIILAFYKHLYIFKSWKVGLTGRAVFLGVGHIVSLFLFTLLVSSLELWSNQIVIS